MGERPPRQPRGPRHRLAVAPSGEPPLSAAAVRELFAGNVRRLRRDAGLTQEEAAERGGLTQRHWQKVEAHETTATLETIVGVANGLQVEIAALFAGCRDGTESSRPESQNRATRASPANDRTAPATRCRAGRLRRRRWAARRRFFLHLTGIYLSYGLAREGLPDVALPENHRAPAPWRNERRGDSHGCDGESQQAHNHHQRGESMSIALLDTGDSR